MAMRCICHGPTEDSPANIVRANHSLDMTMRQVVLDIEATGLEIGRNHRIVELAAVELVDRMLTGRFLHLCFNPEREIDREILLMIEHPAEFYADRPLFRGVWPDLFEFLSSADALVFYNAEFDRDFLNSEICEFDPTFGDLANRFTIVDMLTLARAKHPGHKNHLDALCDRYEIAYKRQSSGAMATAEIIADLFLKLTTDEKMS